MSYNGNSLRTVVVLIVFVAISSGSPEEKQLLDFLLDKYQVLERPVEKYDKNIQLSLDVTLLDILQLDVISNTLYSNLWLTIEWNDFNLKWNPQSFGNITDVRIPPHRVWKPDIFVYNSVDRNFDGTYQTSLVVRSNGSITYITPGIFVTTCKVNLLLYPYDYQRCDMKFGSWTYDGTKMNLKLKHDDRGGDIASFNVNPEWELIAMPSIRNEKSYTCCPAERYIDLTYTVELKRRGDSYYADARTYNMIICISLILSFLAPLGSYFKPALAIGSVTISIWIQNKLKAQLPVSHDSILVDYFGCLVKLTYAGLILNVLTVYLFHKSTRIPNWVTTILKKISSPSLQILCPPSSMPKHNKRILVDSEKSDNSIPEGTTVENFETQWKYLACVVDRCIFLLFVCLVSVVHGVSFPSRERLAL